MTTCPKCGSCRICGPHYRSEPAYAGRGDCLTYHCLGCGYNEEGPTVEQRRRETDVPKWAQRATN